MNNKIAFVLGVCCGAVGSWLYLRKKYEARAEEEIESVRELYKEMGKKEKKPDEKKTTRSADVKEDTGLFRNDRRESFQSFSEVLSKEGYAAASRNYRKLAESDCPYVIRPDQFGEFSDYERIELNMFSDGTLTDDMGEPIEDDIGDMIGEDYMDHFGEYEDDAVYIRNDERKTDYEILKMVHAYPREEDG